MLYDDLDSIFDGGYEDTLYEEVDVLYENYDEVIDYLNKVLTE